MTEIKLATERDLGRLSEIEKSAAQAFLQIPELSRLAAGEVQSIQRHRELMLLGSNWVALTDRNISVGFLSAERLGDELHIWELSVHRNHHGAGIGKALMKRAIQEARVWGLRAVTLTTFRDVPWNAPFYQRLGFEILSPEETDERLCRALRHERASGLPAERRCAMRLLLSKVSG
jgi:GNAT superfamily N-acetyltransferase